MIQAYIQMGAALAGVIGVIVVIGLFVRKKQGKPGMMNVIAYQTLGQKKGIAAVRVGAEVLLLGITSTDVKLLKTLDDHFDEHGRERGTAGDIHDKLTKLKTIKDTLYAYK